MMTLPEIQNEEATRELFQAGLVKGKQFQVLGLILCELGYFSENPDYVKPELVAFGNWLLGKCGILHPTSPTLFSEQCHNAAAALARTANCRDLDALRKKLPKEDKKE